MRTFSLFNTVQWKEEELIQVQKNPSLLSNPNSPLGKPITQSRSLYLPNGATLYFGSTQPKKFYEIEQIKRFSNRNIDLQDILGILSWFHSADEVSQTYMGNAYEKLAFTLERIYQDLGYKEIVDRIKRQGKDPTKAVFCVNDTGMSQYVDFSNEKEFSASLAEKGIGPWPGVELGPITDAQGGIKEFYSAMHNLAMRKEKEGAPLDLRATDDNVYLFFKLTENREDIKIFSFESHVPILSMTKAQGAKSSDVLNSYYFSKSLDSALTPEQRAMSRHELGHEYVGIHSAQAKGMLSFFDFAGIPLTSSHAFTRTSEKQQRPVIVSTQHNALPADKVKKYLPETLYRHEQIEHYQGNANEIRNGAYQAMTRDSSVVVLGEHSDEVIKNYDDYFLDIFDLWCSLHVDKQLRIATFENTPFIVLNKESCFETNLKSNDWNAPEVEKDFVEYLKQINPKEDPWLAFILFTKYLHEKAFVKQEPRFLHTQLDPDDSDLVQKIKKEYDKVKDNPIPHMSPARREQFGLDEINQFEVSILGSASTRVPSYMEHAYDIGYDVASYGWHLRTGGGRHGVMGNASKGALQAKIDGEYLAKNAHISAIQMPNTILFEGAIFHQKEAKVSHDKTLIIEDSFDSRMQSIFRSNITIAMAPGIGTYQEIARWLRIKEAGAPHLKNQKLIILNASQSCDGSEKVRLFDAFLAMVPDHIKEKNLVIVNDTNALKREILKVHEVWLNPNNPMDPLTQKRRPDAPRPL